MKLIKKYLAAFAVGVAGFAVGFICASIFFVAVIIPDRDREKFEFGINTGFTDGLGSAAGKLKSEFGVIDSQSHCKNLFSVKTTDVVSIEIDGVKTVRVIE